MADNLEFIGESQYNAVYKHFKKICENGDTDRHPKDILLQFQLLLNYFRTVYEQSERKTKKILELRAELVSEKSKFHKIFNEAEEEKDVLEKQLQEMQHKLDNYIEEERILTNTIKRMTETVDELKSEEERRTKIEIESEKVGREKQTQSKSVQVKFAAQSTDKIIKKPDVVSVQKLPKFGVMSKEDQVAQKKFRVEIQRLKRKLNIAAMESKVDKDRFETIKNTLEEKLKRKSDAIQNLESQNRSDCTRTKDLEKKMKYLEENLEEVSQDLDKTLQEKKRMEENMRKSQHEGDKLRRQLQDKDYDIEQLKESLNNLRGKAMALKRANMFEENLSIDRERLATARKDIEVLTKSMKKLESDLREKESKLKLNEEQRMRLEAMQEDEVEEHQQTIDHYKKIVQVRDKRLATVESELVGHRQDLASLKLQLRRKGIENARLAAELVAAKKASGTSEDLADALANKLDVAETKNSSLLKEVRESEQKYDRMLQERNRFRTLVNELQSVREYQDTHMRLLNKQQSFLKDTLKSKDEQVERIAKKKRFTWAKF